MTEPVFHTVFNAFHINIVVEDGFTVASFVLVILIIKLSFETSSMTIAKHFYTNFLILKSKIANLMR